MEYNFKKFEQKNVRQENRLTLTKSFSIGYPKKFFQDNEIQNFSFVTLFWDKENLAIGIKFHNNGDDKNAFKVVKNKHGFGGSTISRTFFKSCGIDVQKYHGRYRWRKEYIEGVGNVFVINLNDRHKEKNVEKEEGSKSE